MSKFKVGDYVWIKPDVELHQRVSPNFDYGDAKQGSTVIQSNDVLYITFPIILVSEEPGQEVQYMIRLIGSINLLVNESDLEREFT